MDKIFAVGDIHGRIDKLERLMERLPWDPERDVLVFLGDYLNRGPRSREVIEHLLALQDRAPHAVFLLGNHEHVLLRYAAAGDVEDLRLLRAMRVEATLASYGDAPVESLRDLSFLPAAHRGFLEGLKPFHRAGGYLFTHAGVLPGCDPEAHQADELELFLNVRGAFLRGGEPPQTVVFGHTTFQTPFLAPGMIGIDTGAAYGHLLTAVELPQLRFYHA